MQRWSAPGRVNVIGEHTDYNDGFALPIAIPHAVECTVAPGRDGWIRAVSRQRPGRVAELSLASPAPVAAAGPTRRAAGDWARYPFGVAQEFHRRGFPVPGVTLEIDGAVPIGAGLSSSAALCCVVAVALRDLCAPQLTDRELVEIARLAEHGSGGVPTGVLDQCASVLCTAGHALLLDFRAYAADAGWSREHALIPFDLSRYGLQLLVVDTGEPHDLADGRYAQRRTECAAAAAELGIASLRELTDPGADEPSGPATAPGSVRTAAAGAARRVAGVRDPVLRRRARHVVTENARVLAAAAVLRTGTDPRRIGALLSASHASLRDDFAVSTGALDLAVSAAVTAGAHGARMVGGGFGGSAIALIEEIHRERVTDQILRAFQVRGLAAPSVFPVSAGAGARRIA